MGGAQRDCCPDNTPSQPDMKYADKGWVSWPDWLGYGKRWVFELTVGKVVVGLVM